MATPSMQICMDSSDWLKSIVQEDGRMDYYSTFGELISCSRPLVSERRLRPQHEQALKCPRCDSNHTKFCYYNNYSLSQPRYFCKTCRRYWTKGGSLRNVPVGGGCRKNKRQAAKKASEAHRLSALAFAGVQLPQFSSLTEIPLNLNFMECKYNSVLESPSGGGLDLMHTKYGVMPGSSSSRSLRFMSEGDMGLGVASQLGFTTSGISTLDGNNAVLMEACRRLEFPFEDNREANAADVKSGGRILSLAQVLDVSRWATPMASDHGLEL